jgi:hypothetical protein
MISRRAVINPHSDGDRAQTTTHSQERVSTRPPQTNQKENALGETLP